MTPMRSLYIDMNSFFASVEQQGDPSLCGKPLGITAISAESGACVAASYGAKAFGVKTGTRIFDARRICPGIIFRPSRHRLYVRVNQKIAVVIDQIAELEAVRSVDEFQVGLGGSTSQLSAALELAREIKGAIRSKVGSELRCSVGIGPNHLLAKIAGKLENQMGCNGSPPKICLTELLTWRSMIYREFPTASKHACIEQRSGTSPAIRTGSAPCTPDLEICRRR